MTLLMVGFGVGAAVGSIATGVGFTLAIRLLKRPTKHADVDLLAKKAARVKARG